MDKRMLGQLGLLGLMLGLLFSVQPVAADNFRLYVGEMKVLKLGKISRVAVGNGALMSTSILDDGNLLVLAEAEGDTEVKIWLGNGGEVSHKFYITKVDSTRSSAETRALLRNIPGLRVRRVGANTVVEGMVNEDIAKLLDKAAGKNEDIVNLTIVNSMDDVVQVLSSVPGVKARRVGSHVVLEGMVDKKSKAMIEAAKGAFANVLDFTVDSRLQPEPMIYMTVQITEFNTNALENLGINWSTSFNGPSIGYAHDFIDHGPSNAATALNNQAGSTPLVVDTTLVPGVNEAVGYFGIATLITSSINLAVSSGDALLLASPTLSAKSGGKAEFLSGGQVPVPVPGPNQTTTIEYKDYGIVLNVEPQADETGAVLAKVTTEVSSLDQSVSFGNVPGFRTRKTSTEASLKDGQTLVISGLVNHEIGKDVSKVKWLAEVPILGELFKSTNFRNNRSDLVIFITPHIIDADSEENRAGLAHARKLREDFFTTVGESEEILD